VAVDWDQAEKVAKAFAGHTSRGWIRVNCPLCVRDYKMSLGLNTKTGGYNCFKCGSKGWLPPTLRDLVPDDQPAKPEPEKVVMTLPDGFIEIYSEPGWSASSFDNAREYMRRRGISDSICAGVGVGGVLRGWLAGRVIIPIIEDDQVRGWVARDYTKTALRPYMYPTGMSRHGTLFNAMALREETDEPALIVEGCFDALPYWPDACACLGKPLSTHIPLILAARRPVIISLDGDAWEEGWAFAMKLRHLGGRVGFVKIPAGEDPGSVDPTWLREKARAAAHEWKRGDL